MKYILILFLTVITAAGCADNGNKNGNSAGITNKFAVDTSDIKLEPADDNSPVTLAYAFKKGEKYQYRISSATINSQRMKTADTTMLQTVNQTVTYLISFDVNEADQEAMELSFSINSIKVDAKVNDSTFSYISGDTKDTTKLMQFAEYEALISNPFSVRVNPKGEITEIFRVDKILNKYLKLRNAPDSLSASEKDLVRKDITDAALRPVLAQLFKELPEKKIAADSSWSITQPASQILIFQTQSVNNYKVESLNSLDEDRIAVINAGVNTDFQGSTSYTDRNGVAYNFKRPVTSASGKTYFNITDGCIQKSKTKVKINVDFTMEANTPQGKQKAERADVNETTNIVERL